MGVKSNCKEVIRLLSVFPEKIEENIVPLLEEAGERAVERARASKTYQDQTGNLTASIGYGVIKGGQIIISGGFGNGKGGARGRAALEEHAAEIGRNKYGLIIVAGMDYASYVERTGHVVLDGERLSLDRIVNEVLSQMKITL